MWVEERSHDHDLSKGGPVSSDAAAADCLDSEAEITSEGSKGINEKQIFKRIPSLAHMGSSSAVMFLDSKVMGMVNFKL